MQTFKVSLFGDGGAGKTSWMKKLKTGGFEQRYVATLGVETHSVLIDGKKFNVWDCAGQEKLGGIRDGYFIGSDFGIAVFDCSSIPSLKNVKNWIADFRRVCPDKKVVLVGNKSELMKPRVHTLLAQLNVPYFLISVRNGSNLIMPFISLS